MRTFSPEDRKRIWADAAAALAALESECFEVLHESEWNCAWHCDRDGRIAAVAEEMTSRLHGYRLTIAHARAQVAQINSEYQIEDMVAARAGDPNAEHSTYRVIRGHVA